MVAGPDGPGHREQVLEVTWDPRAATIQVRLDGEPDGCCYWQDPGWFVDSPHFAGPLGTHVSLGSAKANPRFRRDLLRCCLQSVARGLTGDPEPPVVSLD